MLTELHIRILQAQILPIDKSWNYADVCSSYWRLYVNDAPGAAVIYRHQPVPIPPETVFFVPAWVHFNCFCARPVNNFYIHFDLIGLSGPTVRAVFPGPICLETQLDFAQDIRQEICQGQSPPQTVTALCKIKAVIYDQLVLLMDSLDGPARQQLDQRLSAQSIFQPVLEHIETNCTQNLSNTELAGHCHMSESHFIRQFRRHMGLTPAKYVQERRIAQAVQALLFTEDSIEHIAERYGFANRFHFSRVFTRRMGVAPAQYRRTNRI